MKNSIYYINHFLHVTRNNENAKHCYCTLLQLLHATRHYTHRRNGAFRCIVRFQHWVSHKIQRYEAPSLSVGNVTALSVNFFPPNYNLLGGCKFTETYDIFVLQQKSYNSCARVQNYCHFNNSNILTLCLRYLQKTALSSESFCLPTRDTFPRENIW